MRDLINFVNCHDRKTSLFYQGSRRFQPVKRLLICVCLWLAGGWLATAADNPGLSEYDVKAGFLFKLPQFIDWPAGTFAAPDAPIVIGIVGDDPFGKTLDELVKGEIVRGHPLAIKRLNPGDDFKSCQVLFICRNNKEQLPSLLQKLKGSPVLTVGDDNGFADQGSMVNFVLVQGKVKLEINPAAAEQAGLQISAKLLKLARIVNPN